MTNPTHNTPRAFGICRSSSVKQTESCNAQREMIAEQCRRLGLPDPQILEEPQGTSGKIKFAMRPMGSYLLNTLRTGDTLLAVRVDRLGRSMIDVYETVQVLCARGVRVMILRGWGGQVIDLSRATDRLFLMILAWVAETERAMIAERTREGLQHRKDNGLCAGHKLFTHIQAFDAAGNQISKAEFDKLKGHYKLNLPDRQWLDQLVELFAMQKATGLRGNKLYEYCEEREFVDRRGRQWWNGHFHINPKGIPYRNTIQSLLKKVRRMAVLGELPEDYNDRVLAITCDTPAVLDKKFKRKARAAKAADARADWTLEDWQNDFAVGQGQMEA